MIKNNLNGILLIDKETGCTSHDVVAEVRRILSIKEVGHAGTLDPMATGLMIILLGQATKLSSLLVEKNKTYELEWAFGYETDTLDRTGQVLKSDIPHPHPDRVIIESQKMIGSFEWNIPVYSAAKVNGKKLYELARSGQTPSTPKKRMTFWGLNNLSHSQLSGSKWRAQVSCSKGSFIRTWVYQLGKLLESGATLEELRRIQTDVYDIKNAIQLSRLRELSHLDLVSSPSFLPMGKALPNIKAVKLNQSYDHTLLSNGQISHDLRRTLIRVINPDKDDFIQVQSSNEELIGIIGFDSNKGIHIKRIFQ